jgi:phosphatidylinositol kinase/protein kinase (PI-3  family)
MGFEAAPFKMPLEYLDIMGGLDSPGYAYFKKLFKEGFEAARKHSDSLLSKCPSERADPMLIAQPSSNSCRRVC